MKTDEYFSLLKSEAQKAYDIAMEARSRGKDPEDFVEIPMAEDLASRVEKLIGLNGIAETIREIAKNNNREMTSILAAREIAKKFSNNREKALDISIRVGLAILTEGILVAPLEGITDVKIKTNDDGSEYLSIYYSGPIRGAGGTAQALSVLIGDIVRKDLGIGKFKPRPELIERYKEEIQIYGNVEHLQYRPTASEIETVVSNCPVCIDGEGTLDEEVSGYRDLKEIETNRVRGGMCLVMVEGIIQKARKIKGLVEKLKIDGWEFLDKIVEKNVDDGNETSEKFIEDIVAGRPVFAHPGRKGGFRLRYGRCRTGGLATVSVNPATMYVMDKFIAGGTQLKLEFPGKAAGMTACDSVEGPIVLLENGDLIQINSTENLDNLNIVKVYDNGEILIPFGEFLENNYPLKPGSFTEEWWNQIARRKGIENIKIDTFDQAWKISREYDIPLHPKYNLFWHDISIDDVKKLRDYIVKHGKFVEGKLLIPKDREIKEILCELGVLHKERDNYIIEHYSNALIKCLGLKVENDRIYYEIDLKEFNNTIDLISYLCGIRVKPRAPTRVGARMGRPEKAAERKMRPPVNLLFPIGDTFGNRRSISNIVKDNEAKIKVSAGLRICPKCGRKTYRVRCEKCGTRTNYTGKEDEFEISLNDIFFTSIKNLNLDISEFPDVKGVKGLVSQEKLPEPFEKGILRARHGVWVYKDGTARFDMSNLALTHFRPVEIGLTVEKARELGYTKDVFGNDLVSSNQICQIFPQDLIISKSGGDYLLNVSKFIDDLLERFYGLPKYYKCEKREDLIGKLVLGLSPHTSGAVLGRIIGFTDLSACFAHPFFHAAKRRNCDGDEDSVILLLDALLNFSKHYLPGTRGGQMDAPLFMSLRVDPREIDKEALNVDVSWEYPLEFYEIAERNGKPSEAENLIETVKSRLGKENELYPYGFTNDTENINNCVLESSYRTLDSMEEKTVAQLELATKLRAVDEMDVATRILSHHFIPDIMGNMRKYGTQEFRCSKCNRKYRRIPLSGKCECGGNIILTTSQGNITKYLDIAKKLLKEFNVNTYTKQRLIFAEEAIKTLFMEEKEQNGKRLEDFV